MVGEVDVVPTMRQLRTVFVQARGPLVGREVAMREWKLGVAAHDERRRVECVEDTAIKLGEDAGLFPDPFRVQALLFAEKHLNESLAKPASESVGVPVRYTDTDPILVDAVVEALYGARCEEGCGCEGCAYELREAQWFLHKALPTIREYLAATVRDGRGPYPVDPNLPESVFRQGLNAAAHIHEKGGPPVTDDDSRDQAFSDAMKDEYSCWLKDNYQGKGTDGHY